MRSALFHYNVNTFWRIFGDIFSKFLSKTLLTLLNEFNFQLGSILMRVIRTLSVSDSGEEREDEKLKLEQQFRESDQKLDHMVLQRQKELTQVMQRYATVSNRLTTSRTKIRAVKDSLIACKELLHYKRDELKRLWLDGVEHRHVLELLEHM